MNTTQPELTFTSGRPQGQPAIPEVAADDPNIDYLVRLLDKQDWVKSAELCERVLRETGVRWCDRKVRALARASNGRIAGGQKGYKLVTDMTHEEYNHYRNWMLSQCDEMKRRVLESDKLFYAKKATA